MSVAVGVLDLLQQLHHLCLCSCWSTLPATCYHSYSISVSVAVGVPDLQTIDTTIWSTSPYQWYHGSVPLAVLLLLALNTNPYGIHS